MINNEEDKRNRLSEDNLEAKPADNNSRTGDEVPDLDGDGFIGNTGGFYGGTSYLGSNYSEAWGTPEGTPRETEGNFGAAGHKDNRPEDERNESESERSVGTVDDIDDSL